MQDTSKLCDGSFNNHSLTNACCQWQGVRNLSSYEPAKSAAILRHWIHLRPSLDKKCIVRDGLKPFYGRARKFLSCWFLCLPVQTINGLHEPSSTCTRSRFRSRQMFRNLSSLLQEIRLTTTIRESEVLIRTPNFLVLINRECDDSAGYEILTQFWLNPKTALSFFVKYIGIREKMRDPYIKLILLYILFLFCLIKNTNCTIGVWV